MPRAPQKAEDIKDVVAERLRDIRKRIGSQQDLVNRLLELGVKPGGKGGGLADRATIARIELGERRVAVHELYLLAAALGVSPLSLLTPTRETKLRLAPKLTRNSSDVERWALYLQPLDEGDEHIFFSESPFAEHPDLRHPSSEAFEQLERVNRLGKHIESMAQRLEDLRLRVEKVEAKAEDE